MIATTPLTMSTTTTKRYNAPNMHYTDQQKWNMKRSEQELSPALHRLKDTDYTVGYSNPERRIIKGNLCNQFAIVRNQHSANWTLDAIVRGLKWDYKLRTNPDALEVALLNIQPKLLQSGSNRPTRLLLDYVGNQSLLLKSRKLPLICHRADVNLFEQQAEAVLREARQGAVIVSAFISEKERNIRERLLDEQLPVIEICNNGFGKRYKPYGKAFYACAEDRLLQITCWKYEYRKDYICTRPECMVMNELARIITKTADDWWKQ